MSGPEYFLAALGIMCLLGIAGGMVAGAVTLTEDWRKERALIRLARTYGIEYVPGEDIKALRAKVLAKRDRSET